MISSFIYFFSVRPFSTSKPHDTKLINRLSTMPVKNCKNSFLPLRCVKNLRRMTFQFAVIRGKSSFLSHNSAKTTLEAESKMLYQRFLNQWSGAISLRTSTGPWRVRYFSTLNFGTDL